MSFAEDRFTKFTRYTVEVLSVYGPFHANSRAQFGAESSRSELQRESVSLQKAQKAIELSSIEFP